MKVIFFRCFWLAICTWKSIYYSSYFPLLKVNLEILNTLLKIKRTRVHTMYEFFFISLLKVISLLCWVSGGFTPLQVHLLTPLNMHYEPTPLWTIRKCFDIHLQFVEYSKYYKKTVNPSVVQRCQIPLPVSKWDGKTVLETFLVSLFDGVPVNNCIKFGLLCRNNSSVISSK